jgi:hypothetical protein
MNSLMSCLKNIHLNKSHLIEYFIYLPIFAVEDLVALTVEVESDISNKYKNIFIKISI